MNRFPGKLVMAAIILSCGFVMQVEQSERVKMRQATPEVTNRDVASNDHHIPRNSRLSEIK